MLVGKPLAALVIVAVIGYPARTALTVALGLAQIGEFSFILSELARKHGLLGEAGHNVLVACALISITLNPLLFRSLGRIEAALKRWPLLWRLLNRRADRRGGQINLHVERGCWSSPSEPLAVIVGYGPVGRTVDRSAAQERAGDGRRGPEHGHGAGPDARRAARRSTATPTTSR